MMAVYMNQKYTTSVNHVTSFERWFIVNGVHWMGSPLHSGPQLLYREGNQAEELHQLPQNMNLNKKNDYKREII